MKKALAIFHLVLSTGIIALIGYVEYTDFVETGFNMKYFLYRSLVAIFVLSSCLLSLMLLRTNPSIKSKSILLKELTLENAVLAKEIENRSLKEKINKQF
jgi:hypothetical protein